MYFYSIIQLRRAPFGLKRFGALFLIISSIPTMYLIVQTHGIEANMIDDVAHPIGEEHAQIVRILSF